MTGSMNNPASQAPDRPSLSADAFASVAVALFSMTVALGFARVFSDWPFVADMAIVVIVGHGFGLVVRRLRLTPWVAVPLLALVLTWTVLVIYFPDTFSWAMPSGDTWSLLRIELSSVRDQFRVAVAPVNYGGGWDVLAAIGLATAVLLADVFAFRAFARAETLVPGGVLFVFVGALGDDRLRVGTTIALVGVGVVTTAVLRSYHSPENGRFASSALLVRRWPAAVAMGLVVAIAAGVVGPRLPGADAAPMYETRGGHGGGVTEVISPLVDIRSRLTNRSDTELFQVRADVESYWRSSALPDFDGTTWGLPEGELRSADETLVAPVSGAIENRQTVTIAALAGSLVPAAPDPFQASGPDDLRWVPETATLVTVDGDLEEGDVVNIVSAAPVLSKDILEGATSTDAGDPIYTSLPDNLPSIVGRTAAEATAGARTSYETARMLQAWFQRNFEYSLEVQAGHGNDAIENFLRERVGYCEQFAGTYAAMMRTLGIPARVAVGFTSGVLAEDGVYSVRGRNAHAWPEVWFDDIGWVGFEPTPGRGAPNAENYTGLPPQQDTTPAATDPATGLPANGPTLTVPRENAATPPGLNIPDEFADPTGADVTAPTDRGGSASNARWWLLIAALALVVVAAPMVVRAMRARPTGRSSEHQVGAAWTKATMAMRSVGVPLSASLTPNEAADATARHFPAVTRPMSSLADVVTTAEYGPRGVDGFDTVGQYGASTVSDCRNWAKQIDRTATESLGWDERVRRHFTTWR